MSKAKIQRNEDIRRLLEVKDFNKKNQKDRRDSPANSDCSDKSDLSTQSMPQYSSYRTLSGGLFGPFEDSPARPTSRSGFFYRGSTKPVRDMSGSKLKTPSSLSRPRGEGLSRPSSAMAGDTPTRPGLQRENSASRLPVFRREASMPQIKRESSIPQIKREKSDLQKPRTTAIVTPRGSKTQIIPVTTPKTVEQRKVSERNNAAKGTRSGVSGFSDTIMIGDKVMIISNQKKGIVQFVGETRFAKGIWIGVVLNDTAGKNDGSVGGVRYFTCPSLRGVFVREEKLEKLSDARTPNTPCNNGASNLSTVNRNDSAMSTDSGVDEEQELNIGDYVSIHSAAGTRKGILRFVGVTEFAKGTWCGVELQEPTGKNDGAVAGTRYFQCAAKHGIFSQVGKVKKLASPPPVNKQELPRPILPPVEVLVNSVESEEVNDALKAMEASIDDSIVSPNTSQETLKDSSTPNEEVSSAKIVYSKQLSTEHQENTLRLMNQINALEKEKSELETNLNDSKQKVEDLQFQLEEQILLQDDAKDDHVCPVSSEELSKLKEDLTKKDGEISTLQGTLESAKKQKSDNISEKDKQLQDVDSIIKEKDNEVKALQDLLKQAEEKIAELKFKQDEMEADTGKSQKSQIEIASLKESNRMNEEKVAVYEAEVQKLREELSLLEEARQKEKTHMEEKIVELKFKQDEIEAEAGDSQKSQIEITSLKESNRMNEEKVAVYEAEVQKLREELSLLEEARKKEKTHMSQIEATIKELSSAATELDAAKNGNAKLQGSNQVLKQEIETLSKDISNIKTSREFIEEEMSFVRQEKEDLTKEMDERKKQNENNELKIKELARLNEELQGSMKLLETEKEKIQKKCDELTNEHLQKSSDEVNELYKKIKEVEDQLAASEREKLHLKNQWEEEKAKLLSEQDGVKSSVSLLKKEMSELTLQNLTLSNELAELKTNKEFMQEEMECVRQEKDENATEKEILSKKHEEALLKIKKLEQLDQETKEQLEKVTELRQQKASDEMNGLTEENKLKDQKIASYEKDLASLRQQIENMVKLTKTEKDNAANLQSQLDSKTAEVAGQKKELETTQLNITSLRNEMDSTNAQYRESKTREDKLVEELELVKQEKDELCKEKETLNKRYAEATNDISKGNKDLQEQLQKLNETLNGEKNSLEEKIKALSEQNAKKESELTSQLSDLKKQLQDSIDSGNSTKTSLEAENNVLKNNIVTAENSLRTFQSKSNELKAQVTELQEKNTSLQNAAAPSDSGTGNSLQNAAAPSDSGTVSTSQYSQLKGELEKVQSVKTEKEAEVDFLNSIIVDLQKKNKEMDDKVQLLMYGDDLTVPSNDSMNNTMSPVKAGLRMRAFCDICDMFDLHDTEDCPKQCSDEVGSQNHGTRGQERPYCDICETFGHTSENCDDEEMF